MKHNFEEKIPPPPPVLLSDCYVRSPCKDSQNSKYLISQQLLKKTQANIVLQKNREDSSYACKSTCEQNKISSEIASDHSLSDKNSELLQKLEQMKSLKKKPSNKKTNLNKKNHFSYNKDGENQRESFEPNNEQNKSVLNIEFRSSSYQSLQEEEKRKMYKLTPQRGFPKESSSTMANDFSSCTNTSCTTPVKQITREHSSSSVDNTLCPNSPNPMLSSTSSAYLQRNNFPKSKGNCRSLTFSKSSHYFLFFFHKSVLFLMSLFF